MREYVYTNMWAGPPKYDGVYDVDDSVAGIIRTDGPVITLHGAWAQNIGVNETYIDFMGTQVEFASIGADFYHVHVQKWRVVGDKTHIQHPRCVSE